jgi:D-arabinose 1-dehydrogenase-like Zn-dependent alcohol dehydrogenase
MVVRGEHGLGHESAGVVVKLGPGVTEFKEGTCPSLKPS